MGLRPTRAEMKIQSFPLTRGPCPVLDLWDMISPLGRGGVKHILCARPTKEPSSLRHTLGSRTYATKR